VVRHTGGIGRRRDGSDDGPAGTPAVGGGRAEDTVPGTDPAATPSAVTPSGKALTGNSQPGDAQPGDAQVGATRPGAGPEPGRSSSRAGRRGVQPQGAVRTGVQVVATVGTGDKAQGGRVPPDDLPDTDIGPDTGGGPPDHDVRAVLRIIAFRRLWLALALSSFGDWLGLLATAAMAKNLAGGSYTKENFAIAGVFILRLAPAVLLGPLAGALADRFDRRWNLVLGDLLRFVLFASIPLVGTLTWLYSATLLIECFALFWMPAKDATVPNLVPRRRLEAANQISLVATYGTAPLAAVVYSGLALIGELIGHFVRIDDQINPITVALWFNAITFLVSALTIWNLDIPPRTGPAAQKQAGVLQLIVDGWKFVGSSPVVRGLVLGMLGAFAAAGFVIGLAQTFVQDLGAGQAGFGVLFGAVFIGLAGGMWLGPRLLVDFSRRRLFGLSLAAAGVSLLLLALVPDIVLATLCTVVVGACGGVAWVTGYTLLGLEVDDEVRGRTFAFLQSAARVVLVLVLAAGPALAAPIGTHEIHLTRSWSLSYNGAAFVFLLAGALALGMGVTSFRQMDDRTGTPLREDLLRAWHGLRDRPVAPVGRQHDGVFVAFEGGDGAGKTTQVQALAQWLADDQGHEVLVTREPGATRLGVQLRELLLGEGEPLDVRTEALLFAADRAHHVETVIRPALERGAIVISDRYVDSSVAYQGAGREMDTDEIARLSRWATGALIPDLTVLLDLPPEISRVRRAADTQRRGEDRVEAQPEDFHERVRQRFLDLARREPHRYLVLDGSDPREQLQEAIRRRVRDLAPISPARRADLESRLGEEELARQRRAAAEAEVRRLDAELRGRSRDEAQARQEARRRAREEVERQLWAEEAERRARADAERLAEEARLATEQIRHDEQTRQEMRQDAGRGPGPTPTRPADPSAEGPRAGDPTAGDPTAEGPRTRDPRAGARGRASAQASGGSGRTGARGAPVRRPQPPRTPARPPAADPAGPSDPTEVLPPVDDTGSSGAAPRVPAGGSATGGGRPTEVIRLPETGEGEPEDSGEGRSGIQGRGRPGWLRRSRRGAEGASSGDLGNEIFGRRREH
jgi:dTMP kinase